MINQTLDQSFSSENFRKILDLENRKGIYLEKRYFPEIAEVSKEIKDKRQLLVNKKVSGAAYDRTLVEIEKLSIQRESLIDSELEKISKNVVAGKRLFDLNKIMIKGKPAYTEHAREAYFANKQVQFNIWKLYKVKQANRHSVTEQVLSLLNDGFGKILLRIDIKDFYESIPHDLLLNKISNDNLLTHLSKKIIWELLNEYSLKSTAAPGAKKGVPRGIGISAYLAELFMRGFDEKVRDLPDLTYYARYVDDIVVVFTPSNPMQHPQVYLDDILKIVASHGLATNPAKEELIDLRAGTAIKTFNYLGYEFNLATLPIQVSLSQRKISKLKKRIDLSINDFNHFSKKREKKARKTLINRIKFLTRNTRLLNNKENVMTGIYYSNSFSTNESQFQDLDTYLQRQISLVANPRIRDRVKQYSFLEGFTKKLHASFTSKELGTLTRAWKNEA